MKWWALVTVKLDVAQRAGAAARAARSEPVSGRQGARQGDGRAAARAARESPWRPFCGPFCQGGRTGRSRALAAVLDPATAPVAGFGLDSDTLSPGGRRTAARAARAARRSSLKSEDRPQRRDGACCVSR